MVDERRQGSVEVDPQGDPGVGQRPDQRFLERAVHRSRALRHLSAHQKTSCRMTERRSAFIWGFPWNEAVEMASSRVAASALRSKGLTMKAWESCSAAPANS